MLQSEYEHLYDNITLDNIKSMVKQPEGSVIIEDFEFCGTGFSKLPNPPHLTKVFSYKVNSAGHSFYYYSIEDGKLLYTENHQPSVFRLP